MLLDINKLNLSFTTDTGLRQPVETQVLFDVSLSIKRGETVALVGESGSGKSVTALSIMRLLEEMGVEIAYPTQTICLEGGVVEHGIDRDQ